MIRLLFYNALTLGVACALLIALMPTLGERLPDNHAISHPGFQTCTLPCWSNITPGQTPFYEALPLLRASLPADVSRIAEGGTQINFWTREGDHLFSGFLFYVRGYVGYIRLYVRLSIGELVARLGVPDCVWLETTYTGEEIMVLYWEQDGVLMGAMVTMIRHERWRPATETTNLWMDTSSHACDQRHAVAWIGFAPLRRYKAMIDDGEA
jgi:hypothetical protein